MASPYQLALEAAIAASKQAGAILLHDLRREGGPRGSGSHADADLEAEMQIRQTLLSATGTSFRYLGEETGRVDGTAGEDSPIWIVDPNDGTNAYLRGFRGSSVSIGVVHRGVPVLGVVFAYAFPDDDGELVAWAEGLPMATDVSSTTLDDRAVVAVSQDADLNPDANAACVAPGRYWPFASIAHRLARVATGDVDAAVCLSGIASWDVAAGHALVRAAGGVLVDENGRAITYDADGNCSARWCFGGAKGVVDAIRTRAWDDVRSRPRATTPFVRPGMYPRVDDAARLRSAQNALLAALERPWGSDAMVFARRVIAREPAADGIDPRAVACVRAVVDGTTNETPSSKRRTVLTERRFDRPLDTWGVDALMVAEALISSTPEAATAGTKESCSGSRESSGSATAASFRCLSTASRSSAASAS